MGDLQAEIEFPREMGEPRHRGPTPQAGDPSPVAGEVDQGVQQERQVTGFGLVGQPLVEDGFSSLFSQAFRASSPR